MDRVGRQVREGSQERLVGVCWVCRRAVDRQGVGGRVGRAAVNESRSACRSNESWSVQVLALQFKLPTRGQSAPLKLNENELPPPYVHRTPRSPEYALGA